MSGKTYGDLPGVNVTVTGGSVQGVAGGVDLAQNEAAIPGIRLWGHRIVLNGESGIRCEECEMEEEIPEVFRMSSGFKEVVYKLYILGKFKHERCEPSLEVEDIFDEDTINDNVTVDPNRIHWVGGDTYTANGNGTVDVQIPRGTRMMFEGEEYVYEAPDTFVHAKTGEQFHPVDLTMKHGEDALTKLPPGMAKDVKSSLKEMSTVDKTVDGPISIGDVQSNVGLQQQAQQPTATVNANDMTAEQQKSLREKFAEKVKNSDRNPLTR